MDASTALRSFRDITGTISRVKSLPMHTNLYTLGKLQVSGFAVHGDCFFPLRTKSPSPISCAKTGEATAKAKSSDGTTQGSKEKITSPIPTFPSSFEALLLEVCDETEIAELKLKIGGLEMHVKRNVGASKALISVPSPTTPPPVPTEPMEKSGAAVPAPSSPKSSPEKTTPFTNVSFGKSPRLEALEASGSSGYVLVSSPTVGSFRRGRTLKGKKQPPSCKEGDFIKEGQVIGWLDQFGTELPVKSDVSGEVIKRLVADGEAVGYGDPLIAVLPSFHGININ